MIIKNITDFKTNKWSGGTTTELFIYPNNSDYQLRNFIFRISSATVDIDKSTFTNLNGFKRFISPLSGELNISHNNIDFKPLAINEIYEFDGGINTLSTGCCRDFNLMLNNNTKGEIHNKQLECNNLLTINFLQNEIVWVFSYNNICNINIDCNNKQQNNIKLQTMNLFVFQAEQSDPQQNMINLSTDDKSNLFYGKVLINNKK